MPCALNAADEVAVAAFLERRLPFLGIAEVIEGTLARTPRVRFEKMDDVLAADTEARRSMRRRSEPAGGSRGSGFVTEKEGYRGYMSTLIGVFLVLGVMILVHEWGHFVVARLLREFVSYVFDRVWAAPVRLQTGRAILITASGMILLNGYVRMAGQRYVRGGYRSGSPTGAPDELYRIPLLLAARC